MKLSENGAGLSWYGHLDPTPPDLDWGRLSQWKSFATLYTKKWERDYGRPDKLTLKDYNCFEIRFKGDGRRYELDVHGNRERVKIVLLYTFFDVRPLSRIFYQNDQIFFLDFSVQNF
jgi:hypothetical protein